MLWLGVLAIAGIAAALLLPPLTLSRPSEPGPEVVLTVDNARGFCMELSENPKEYLSSEEWDRRRARRAASCDMAFAAAPYDLTLKVRVALALPHEQRAEELAMARPRRRARRRPGTRFTNPTNHGTRATTAGRSW
jgi:hypothetical protein